MTAYDHKRHAVTEALRLRAEDTGTIEDRRRYAAHARAHTEDRARIARRDKAAANELRDKRRRVLEDAGLGLHELERTL